MAIRLVGISKPVDYQVHAGVLLQVVVPPAFAGDVHVAQVTCRANSTPSFDEAGWVLQDNLATGSGLEHIRHTIWTFVNQEDMVARWVLIRFTAELGEKWVGVHTFRGADTARLIASIAGNNQGDI